jgi:hypothetical protein
MKIPPFTRYKFVENNGELSAAAEHMLDVFFQQAQENLSDDGLVVPSLPTSDINYISSSSNQNARPNGTLWYDYLTNELKVKINGVVKIIQTI